MLEGVQASLAPVVELVLLPVVPLGRQVKVRIAPEVEAAAVEVALEAVETPEVVPVVVPAAVPDDVVAPVVPLATEVAAVVVERPVELLEAASLTSVFVAQHPLAATSSPAQSSVCRPSIGAPPQRDLRMGGEGFEPPTNAV